VDHLTRIEPILSYFKKADAHMGIVTMVIEEEGKDPEFKKVGIFTLEDIVEVILQSKIHDEKDYELKKGQRKKMREKMIMLFSNHKARHVLSSVEIQSVSDYLSSRVKIFNPKRMKKHILDQLINNSEVHELESSSVPFINTNDIKNDESSLDVG
jgi:CBS domain containing-hemolysin-like protein